MLLQTTVFLAALGGTIIELIEIAAVTYAVGYGKKLFVPALGALLGMLTIAILSVVAGVAVIKIIPLNILQVITGSILIWFGYGLLKKSTYRIIEHKQPKWFTQPLDELHMPEKELINPAAVFIATYKFALTESLEVAIVALTLGMATLQWYPVLYGVIASILIMIVFIIVAHNYITKLPAVKITLFAGILLTAFGIFWLGQGFGLRWMGGEIALGYLILIITIIDFIFIHQKIKKIPKHKIIVK